MKNISKIYKFFRAVIKNYIFFAFYLLSRPNLLILPFKGAYLPQYLQFEWISKFKIGTFIDIGALDGNVSKVINYISPQTDIYAFEPLKQKISLIKSKIKSNKFIVENLALTDYTGNKNFYEYNFLAASSFLKPNPKIHNKYVAKNYSVEVTTLDRYFSNKKLKKPIFIKMDTEGTEDLIIKGGQKLLKQASLIIVETGFVETWKNSCFFEDIYTGLTKLGFIYKGRMQDSYFYPLFEPMAHENSIFIKKGELLNYL